jgi:hypothetical protein
MLATIATAIIEDGMNTLRERLIDKQQAMGLRDRGLSAKSLSVSVASTDTTIAGQLMGFERWKWQESGHGPTPSRKPSRELVEEIRAWTKRKGIEIKAAYPIALKIAREGTKVPNKHNPGGVLSSVLTAEAANSIIGSRLRTAVFNEVKSSLFETK